MQPPCRDTEHWPLSMRRKPSVDLCNEPLAKSDSRPQVPQFEKDATSITPPIPSCDSGYGGSPKLHWQEFTGPIPAVLADGLERLSPPTSSSKSHTAASIPTTSVTAQSSPRPLHRFTSTTRQAYDAVHSYPFARILKSFKWWIPTHGPCKTPAPGLYTATTTPSSLVHCGREKDNNSQHDGDGDEVAHWISATEHAAVTSIHSSLIAPVQSRKKETISPCNRALLLESWSYLQAEHDPHEIFETWQGDDSTESYAADTNMACTTTDGSGSDDPPKSAITSHSTSIGSGSKVFPSLSRSNPKRYESEDDDGYPHKRPNGKQQPWDLGITSPSSHKVQMRCPLLERHGCQGTNPSISELKRSLMSRHGIGICEHCCTRLPISDDEKTPKELLKLLDDHVAGCVERRCIGSSCGNALNDSASHPRRTGICPSWATLSKEIRWRFMWTLVNPQLNPPNPNFLLGPNLEHIQERRPVKQRAQPRGIEKCPRISRDIEADERRIIELEIDLAAAKNETGQVQQQRNDKVANLENIIESFVELLSYKGIEIPGSVRKRLQNECPDVMAGILTKELQTMPALPTSAFTTNHGQYPVSGMSSAWGHMSFPPPAMPTIPATWNTAPQQMVVSNPGYYFPDFSDKAPTASAMYQTDAYIPVSNSISMSPSIMHVQVGRYSSAETPETVQPYK